MTAANIIFVQGSKDHVFKKIITLAHIHAKF